MRFASSFTDSYQSGPKPIWTEAHSDRSPSRGKPIRTEAHPNRNRSQSGLKPIRTKARPDSKQHPKPVWASICMSFGPHGPDRRLPLLHCRLAIAASQRDDDAGLVLPCKTFVLPQRNARSDLDELACLARQHESCAEPPDRPTEVRNALRPVVLEARLGSMRCDRHDEVLANSRF